MKIVAKLNSQNPTMIDALKAKRILPKLLKNGGLIVELPKTTFSFFDSVDYVIPTEVVDGKGTLLIDLCEFGGAKTKTGCGTIVCGLNGEMLKPYYIPSGQSCGEHAHFSVAGPVVTISGARNSTEILIEGHVIIRGNTTAKISSKNLWHGLLENLPEEYQKFYAAGRAAVDKSNCFHCREAHYVPKKVLVLAYWRAKISTTPVQELSGFALYDESAALFAIEGHRTQAEFQRQSAVQVEIEARKAEMDRRIREGGGHEYFSESDMNRYAIDYNDCVP